MNQKLNINGNGEIKNKSEKEIDERKNWEDESTSLNVSHGEYRCKWREKGNWVSICSYLLLLLYYYYHPYKHTSNSTLSRLRVNSSPYAFFSYVSCFYWLLIKIGAICIGPGTMSVSKWAGPTIDCQQVGPTVFAGGRYLARTQLHKKSRLYFLLHLHVLFLLPIE